VLHLKTTVLDGEQVVDVEPDIGYLHRSEEQMAQSGTYRHQIMPYPDRWDYISAGLLNEWAYARAAEDLADIEVPEYAQVIRTMGAEMCRIAAHMLALATFALDINGDFTATFMYAINDRERVQNLLEDLTGQRLMFNYFRLGGVVWDLPEPRDEFFSKTRDFLDHLPESVEEYHNLITSNEIFQMRTIDTGILPPEVAKNYGATGPVARGSGSTTICAATTRTGVLRRARLGRHHRGRLRQLQPSARSDARGRGVGEDHRAVCRPAARRLAAGRRAQHPGERAAHAASG